MSKMKRKELGRVEEEREERRKETVEEYQDLPRESDQGELLVWKERLGIQGHLSSTWAFRVSAD